MRGRLLCIVAFMGYTTTTLWELHLHLFASTEAVEDDGRRLSEAQSRPQAPLRPWLDPPAPLINGEAWNATRIRWVGNSFYIFNSDSKDEETQHSRFQLYTPHQIQKAFRHHSILLQGDSTVRRLYGSMHGILSYDVWTGSADTGFPRGFPAQVPNPPFGIPVTYFVRRGLEAQSKSVSPEKLLSLLIHSPSPIDPRLLEHRTIVDVNKDFWTEPCHKKFPSSYVMHTPSFEKASDDINELDQRDKDITRAKTFKSSQFEYKICRPKPSGGWIPSTPTQSTLSNRQTKQQPSTLSYDYINTNCLGHIYDFVSQELSHQTSITRQYSVYIVGPGVWETVKQSACNNPFYEGLQLFDGQQNNLEWPDSIYQLLQATLEKMAILAEQSPGLLIIWRTSGYYDGDTKSHVIHEMNKRAKEFISNWNKKRHGGMRGKKSNFLCMDFGSTVEHRSHGRARLKGDMQAHYGLEARVLQVQMLTNILYEHGYAK